MTNYIVLRDSPDWPSFDPETTRQYCRARELPETTILDFIAIWNRVSRIDYRTFRHRLRQIALDNLRAVENATVVSHREFRDVALSPDDLAVFTDDDDWLAPDLFVMARKSANDDGVVWGSIRIGVIFTSGSRLIPDTYFERPFTSRRLFTNNYAATSMALAKVGIDTLLEQSSAQAELDRGAFRPRLLVEYLSCTVRHPARSAAAAEFMASESFKLRPRDALAKVVDDLARIDLGAPWTQAPWQAMMNVVRAALP